jgi:hypothetical protein
LVCNSTFWTYFLRVLEEFYVGTCARFN